MAVGTTVAPVRVLIVENDADTRKLLARCLTGMSDFAISGADGFDSAITAARETKFDLMLIDIGLGDESGVDLLKQLLENGPCRALALTGYGSESDIEEYKEAGFAGWIIKPINPDQLLSAMNQALGLQDKAHALSR
jgi:two-component system CheB/CheR fusion protein